VVEVIYNPGPAPDRGAGSVRGRALGQEGRRRRIGPPVDPVRRATHEPSFRRVCAELLGRARTARRRPIVVFVGRHHPHPPAASRAWADGVARSSPRARRLSRDLETGSAQVLQARNRPPEPPGPSGAVPCRKWSGGFARVPGGPGPCYPPRGCSPAHAPGLIPRINSRGEVASNQDPLAGPWRMALQT